MKKNPLVTVVAKPDEANWFREQLSLTLSLLGCELSIEGNWHDFLSKVSSRTIRPDLIILDPTLKHFAQHEFRSHVLENSFAKSLKIGVLRDHPQDDLHALENALDVDASFFRCHAPHEIGFLINRLLFPQKQNRRLHPRALHSFPVMYTSEATKTQNFGESVDLSSAGIFIRSYNPIDPGTHVRLWLDAPQFDRPIESDGVVVHARKFSSEPDAVLKPPGIGIYFEEMTYSEKAILFEYITPYLPRADRRATQRSMDY